MISIINNTAAPHETLMGCATQLPAVIVNNIFMHGITVVDTVCTMDYNCAIVTGGSQGPHDILVDPLFQVYRSDLFIPEIQEDCLQLMPNSPCKDVGAGQSLYSKVPSFDILGNPRSQDSVDIGAYEYTGDSRWVYYVNASGTNTFPYDTVEKGATNFHNLFKNFNTGGNDTYIVLLPGSIIETVDDGEINDNFPIDAVNTKAVTIRSWSGNANKPVIRCPVFNPIVTSGLFNFIDYYELWEEGYGITIKNLRMRADVDGLGEIGTHYFIGLWKTQSNTIPGVKPFPNVEISGCEFYANGVPYDPGTSQLAFMIGVWAYLGNDSDIPNKVDIKNNVFRNVYMGVYADPNASNFNIINNSFSEILNAGICTGKYEDGNLINNILTGSNILTPYYPNLPLGMYLIEIINTPIVYNDNYILNDYVSGFEPDPPNAPIFIEVGPENIKADPLFISSSDLQLQDDSPCIAAGIGSSIYSEVPTVDYNNDSRPLDIVTIGAYEKAEEPIIDEDDRYWVASTTENWDNTSNWSNTSGGTPGYSVPGENNRVYFDLGGIGSCDLDATVNVLGMKFFSSYPGDFNQNGYSILIDRSGGYFDGGYFNGSSERIRVKGNLYIGGCSFTSTDSTLSCDSTFTCLTNNFAANGGVVSLDSNGCVLNTPDMTMSVLQFNAIARIDALCFTQNIVLKSGAVREGISDATVCVFGNVYGESGYNVWTAYNSIPLQLDSTLKQMIYNETGCVFPSLIIDKKTSTPVVLDGYGPFYINKDFIINDGTFNSNNIDLQVGLFTTIENVRYAPIIIVQPIAQNVNIEDTLTLSLVASGTGLLHYQWAHDGTNIGTDSSVYQKLVAQETDSGNYKCTVTNNYGLVESDTVLVTVLNMAPSIGAYSFTPLRYAGDLLWANIFASGAEPLHYQWTHDGTNIGTDSTAYEKLNALESDSGDYRCTVTNSYGLAESPIMTITVYSVIIDASTFRSTLDVGDFLWAYVYASGAEPLHYQWTHDGTNIGTDSTAYEKLNAQISDSGDYRCTVTNSYGFTESPVMTITVSESSLILPSVYYYDNMDN